MSNIIDTKSVELLSISDDELFNLLEQHAQLEVFEGEYLASLLMTAIDRIKFYSNLR